MYENGVNGLLADEMGLGKTVQSIALLAHLVEMGVPGPFLVVAPLSTLHNWCNEIRAFAPQVSSVQRVQDSMIHMRNPFCNYTPALVCHPLDYCNPNIIQIELT